MGLAIVLVTMLAVLLIYIAVSIIISAMLFIISFIRQKKGKSYKALRYISLIFILPVIFIFIYAIVSNKLDERALHGSLAYHVYNEDYAGALKLIEEGASPDCNLKSNEEAKEDDFTVVLSLCVPHFVMPEEFEGLVNDYNRFTMLRFMLDNGANVNKVRAFHEKDYAEHSFEGADWRNRSDFCGETPLIYAIRNNDYEVAKLLIEEYGADVNAVDYCGFNAAAIAASELSKENADKFLELLYENGCEMNVKTNYNITTKELYEKRKGDYPY